MPPSLVTGSFVLGAILLLIALLAGKFKIFGFEAAGDATHWARIFSGVVGLVLIIVPLWSEQSPSMSDDQGRAPAPSAKPSHESEVNRPAPPQGGVDPLAICPLEARRDQHALCECVVRTLKGKYAPAEFDSTFSERYPTQYSAALRSCVEEAVGAPVP